MENIVAVAQIVSAIATFFLAILTLLYVLATNRMAKGSDEMVREMRDGRAAQDRANSETLEENRRLVEVNRQTLEELQAGRLAQQRPLVVVDVDYSEIPMLVLKIRNIGWGAARNVRFWFFSPLMVPEKASPIGEGEIILSDLPVFSRGIDFLAPGAEIPIRWGGAQFIINDLYDRKLDRSGVRLNIIYETLDGHRYLEENWRINPVDMKEIVSRPLYTQEDMVEAVTKAAEKINKAVDIRSRLKIITATEKKQEDEGRWNERFGKTPEDRA